MHKFLSMALVAVFSMNSVGVLASDNSPFIGSCINEKKGVLFAEVGCANADDRPCLCKNAKYFDAVSGCAAAKSSATPDEVREALTGAGGFCEQFAAQVPGASQAPSQAPQSSDNAANTPSPTPEPTPEPTPQPTPTPASSSTPTPAATSSEFSSPAVSPETSAPTPLASSTTAPSSTATKVSETSPVTSPDAASGLSQGAMAGIGIGVAAVVIVLAVVAFCLFKRRKGPAPRQSMEISKPLPGSGRTYPTHDHDRDSFDKYATDIAMTSNRYEDMSTGQQPRTMV